MRILAISVVAVAFSACGGTETQAALTADVASAGDGQDGATEEDAGDGRDAQDSGDAQDGDGSDGVDGSDGTAPDGSGGPDVWQLEDVEADGAAEVFTPDAPVGKDNGSDGEPEDVVADTGPADTGPGDAADTAQPPKDTGPIFTEPPTAAQCFAGQMGAAGVLPVDYDQHEPLLGKHCKGTNHQEIKDIERVVFVGDSITVGTPPTATEAWYRNILAVELAQRFGLEAPSIGWQNVDLINGVSYEKLSGDFATCAKWGARTDDLTKDPHKQMVTCMPPEERDKRTLVIMTMGGNDIFSWAQDYVAGTPPEQLWLYAEEAVADLEAAIHWAKDDPTLFPNGIDIVFANTYEFTDVDSGSDLATCPGANIISMDKALVDPVMTELVAWMMGEYMRIAVETGTDMAFMGEHYCGHGYMYDNPEGRCYRGPGAELYLDITCMHPGAPGHAAIADLFLAIIDE